MAATVTRAKRLSRGLQPPSGPRSTPSHNGGPDELSHSQPVSVAHLPNMPARAGWFSRCYEPQNDPPRNPAAASAVAPTASLANQYFTVPPLRCDNKPLLSFLRSSG